MKRTRAAGALAAEIGQRLDALPRQDVPTMRDIRRKFSKSLRDAPAATVIAVALALLKHGLAGRFIGYELIHHHPAALSSLTESDLKKLGDGMDSWGIVDCFACFLAGPAWREGRIADRVVHGWARLADRWWRRAALASTVPLNNRTRGGRGDAARTLRVCKLLVADRDDMVVKAMSWALRELAKRDPAAAEAFLAQHADVLAPRVVRELRNKLTTGRKNPRPAG